MPRLINSAIVTLSESVTYPGILEMGKDMPKPVNRFAPGVTAMGKSL